VTGDIIIIARTVIAGTIGFIGFFGIAGVG
jgi:hypothetical protein